MTKKYLQDTQISFPLMVEEFLTYLEVNKKGVTPLTLTPKMAIDFLGEKKLDFLSVEVRRNYLGNLIPVSLDILVDNFDRREGTLETLQLVHKRDGFVHVSKEDALASPIHFPNIGLDKTGFAEIMENRVMTLKELSNLYLKFQGLENLESGYEMETQISTIFKVDIKASEATGLTEGNTSYVVKYDVFDPEYTG